MTTFASTWSELCGLVAARLHTRPGPVMGYDLVVVSSAGHQRALSQVLANAPGGPQITAGLKFVQLPRLESHLAQLLVADGQLDDDGWRGVALQLGLLELLADTRFSPDLEPVLRHVGAPGERPGRAHATAQRIAAIFRRYATHAPAMVAAWRDGRDTGPGGQPLGARDQWQPAAWRGLTHLLGPDPALRRERLLGLVQAAPVPGLPERILLALVDDPPPSTTELLDALAKQHEVHGFLLGGTPDGSRPMPTGLPAAAVGPARPSDPLLKQVQHELRSGQPAGERTQADPSFQIHACHGPNRQVEVLRDVLCGLFSDDPTLQPRDVVVLCPALAEYAPLVAASFGLDPQTNPGLHPGHRLRAQIAAPAISALNPVLAVLTRLFELYAGRATNLDLLDLCQLPPVTERFGFTGDDLESARQLIDGAQVRWGLDAAQRQRNQVPINTSTWLAGMQRMLVSLALDVQPLVDMKTVTPVGQIEGSHSQLIGRLAELVSRVRKVTSSFETAGSAAQWSQRLREAIDLLTAVEPSDQWQLTHAYGVLADLAEQGAGRTAMLHASDVAAWLAQQQQAGARRPNYGNGSMIFTSLDDLAAIDARVICVLGLDDTTFPGVPTLDGDDLLDRPGAAGAQHWTTDRRLRHRQRLRDAMLAAEQAFIVVTQGADETSGSRRPLPLCIAELLELCSISGPAGAWESQAPNALVKWHPLHAHGWAAFASEADGQPASFDTQALQGARQLTHPRVKPVPLWKLQVPVEASDEPVSIDDLITFYTNPARAHFRNATGTTLVRQEEPPTTSLPIDLNGLQRWQLGTDLYELLLAGVAPEQAERSALYSGQVLANTQGQQMVQGVLDEARELADMTLQARAGEPAHFADCRVDLGRHRLQGRVQMFGNRVVAHRFGRVKEAQVLGAWLRLLLLSASGRHDPAQLDAVVVGRYAKRLTAPGQLTAQQLLGELVEVRNAGLGMVLPLPIDCAASYSGWYGNRSDPMTSAWRTFDSTNSDIHWKHYYPSFDDLLASEPLPADPVAGSGPATTRFEGLTGWLLGPMTEHQDWWTPEAEARL